MNTRRFLIVYFGALLIMYAVLLQYIAPPRIEIAGAALYLYLFYVVAGSVSAPLLMNWVASKTESKVKQYLGMMVILLIVYNLIAAALSAGRFDTIIFLKYVLAGGDMKEIRVTAFTHFSIFVALAVATADWLYFQLFPADVD
ncbi:MAG TPA: hypothetical protein VGD65_07975 [Chryseosolibacter sp.]